MQWFMAIRSGHGKEHDDGFWHGEKGCGILCCDKISFREQRRKKTNDETIWKRYVNLSVSQPASKI